MFNEYAWADGTVPYLRAQGAHRLRLVARRWNYADSQGDLRQALYWMELWLRLGEREGLGGKGSGNQPEP